MLIASIDLMGGKVVQLRQGKEKVLERDDPLALAKEFDRYGEVAVIDLDAAMNPAPARKGGVNQGENLEIIKRILKIAECRVGGGIRTIKKAKELISFGAVKVIIGSTAFENDRINNSFLQELASAIGRDRIIVAIDAINGEIVTQGWKHKTGLGLFDVINKLENYCSEFLYTCVEKEGLLQGIDMEKVRGVVKATKNKVTVAGGVKSIDEIREIGRIGADAQIGMALYTDKISIKEAFIESLNWKNEPSTCAQGLGELIPTVTQDCKGGVLNLAYSNKASLKNAFETGKMWYFSRSRNKLWMKGETSGNTQELIRIRADCDQDTLLATVKQKGVACHTGSYSCFGGKKFNLNELYEVIQDRIKNPAPQSYTATLTDELLKEKIMEEADEVIRAKTKDEIIWEAADVMYFLTVLLAKNGVEIDDVLFELARRRIK
ncbi:MAG: bifunctional phosphoribosyl-AMP cyclohydrolase/phosphoribosyl-ATP diphosphatase HisIE [Planctomycetota bacterium]